MRPAELFVIIARNRDGKNRLVIFNARTGTRYSDLELPSEIAQASAAATKHLVEYQNQLKNKQGKALAISSIRLVGIPDSRKSEIQQFLISLERKLLKIPEITLLDRINLEQVSLEREISDESFTIAPSAALLRLEILAGESTGDFILNGSVLTPMGKPLGSFTGKLPEAIETATAEIVTFLQKLPPDSDAPRSEAETFFAEYKVRKDQRQSPDEWLPLIAAAIVLAPDNSEYQMAYLDAFMTYARRGRSVNLPAVKRAMAIASTISRNFPDETPYRMLSLLPDFELSGQIDQLYRGEMFRHYRQSGYDFDKPIRDEKQYRRFREIFLSYCIGYPSRPKRYDLILKIMEREFTYLADVQSRAEPYSHINMYTETTDFIHNSAGIAAIARRHPAETMQAWGEFLDIQRAVLNNPGDHSWKNQYDQWKEKHSNPNVRRYGISNLHLFENRGLRPLIEYMKNPTPVKTVEKQIPEYIPKSFRLPGAASYYVAAKDTLYYFLNSETTILWMTDLTNSNSSRLYMNKHLGDPGVMVVDNSILYSIFSSGSKIEIQRFDLAKRQFLEAITEIPFLPNAMTVLNDRLYMLNKETMFSCDFNGGKRRVEYSINRKDPTLEIERLKEFDHRSYGFPSPYLLTDGNDLLIYYEYWIVRYDPAERRDEVIPLSIDGRDAIPAIMAGRVGYASPDGGLRVYDPKTGRVEQLINGASSRTSAGVVSPEKPYRFCIANPGWAWLDYGLIAFDFNEPETYHLVPYPEIKTRRNHLLNEYGTLINIPETRSLLRIDPSGKCTIYHADEMLRSQFVSTQKSEPVKTTMNYLPDHRQGRPAPTIAAIAKQASEIVKGNSRKVYFEGKFASSWPGIAIKQLLIRLDFEIVNAASLADFILDGTSSLVADPAGTHAVIQLTLSNGQRKQLGTAESKAPVGGAGGGRDANIEAATAAAVTLFIGR